MTRPTLNEIPLSDVVPVNKGSANMTIDVGAWDGWIEAAYNTGFILLEIKDERPVRAFRKSDHCKCGKSGGGKCDQCKKKLHIQIEGER